MTPADVLGQFLSGLARAGVLFLIAAGLSFIFGVVKIVNFAHGALYMVGAFLTFSFTKTLGLPFWVAIALAAVSVAVIGLVIEIVIFRRVYGRPVADQLLLTFAMVLIIHDVVRLGYGSNLRSVSRPPLLAGALFLGDVIFPSYYLFIVVVGVGVLVGFWAFLHKTRLGKTIRAAVGNREMVACLGKPLPWLFTAAFAAGVFVDGLAGAIAAPLGGIRLGMDFDIIILAFATVIVGGFGSLPGTALAAFIIGEAYAFGIWLMPAIALSLPFIIMAAVLIVRPWGLLGRSGGGEL
jgi:branched-subunit amino acid ABC-type transport system permease component